MQSHRRIESNSQKGTCVVEEYQLKGRRDIETPARLGPLVRLCFHADRHHLQMLVKHLLLIGHTHTIINHRLQPRPGGGPGGGPTSSALTGLIGAC